MSRRSKGGFDLNRRTDNGIWEISWYDAELRRTCRKSTGSRDFAVAQRILAETILDVGERPDPLRRSVKTILDDYHQEHVAKKSGASQTFQFGSKHLYAFFGDMSLTDISSSDVERYVYGRRPAKDGTIRRELGILVAAMNYSVRTKRISKDVIPHITLPPPSPVKERWLTTMEARRLLLAAHATDGERLSRISRFLEIALATGARRGAILELAWAQVDTDNFTRIDFNPPGRLQSNKRRPIVPVSSRLKPVLERSYKERCSEFVLDDPGAITSSFRSAVKRAGLTDVSPHVLRHTFATWALQDGVDPYQVAGMLGDRLDTVLKRYGHHCPDYLKSAVEAVAGRV